MEILIILILILLAIIIPIPIFKPLFIFLSAVAIFLSRTITLPYIVQISGDTMVYATLDTLLQWALGLIMLTTSIILFLDLLKNRKREKEKHDSN